MAHRRYGEGKKDDSRCGSVGRALASETRDLQFEPSHRQIKYILSTVLKRQREALNVPIFKKESCVAAGSPSNQRSAVRVPRLYFIVPLKM